MKTELKKIASFLAVAISADGAYEDYERETVATIAEALGLDKDELDKAVDAAVAEVDPMDDEQLNQYLIEAAVDIDEDDTYPIFECALEIVLADLVVTREEVGNLLAMADALGIDTEDAVLMLADMVNEEDNVEILIEKK